MGTPGTGLCVAAASLVLVSAAFYSRWLNMLCSANPWLCLFVQMMLLHGSADGTVPPLQSEHMADALAQGGQSKNSDLIKFDGDHSSFLIRMMLGKHDVCLDIILAFVMKQKS